MIKLLIGELEPQTGTVWKHSNIRVAYVAQHAFHHIEKHLNKTPNEYIRWRYQYGEDKEGLEKASNKVTETELNTLKTEMKISIKDSETGKITFIKRFFNELTGNRKYVEGEFLYEVSFSGLLIESNMFLSKNKIKESFKENSADNALEKLCTIIDDRISALQGQYRRTLGSKNVENHLGDVGLEPEYSTHTRIAALSGGQKVKVVLAAALWNQPHIIILDEPTNYLDREALGALAGAIEEFEGGVVMITHNNDFCSALCPETWVLEKGRMTCQGDPEWMKNVMNEKVEYTQIESNIDAFGNISKVKQAKKNYLEQR